MHFWNVRRHFATNSSSSHSMIVVPDASSFQEQPEEYHASFGWDNFTLSTDDGKKRYLRALLGTSLQNAIGFDATNAVLEDLGLTDPTMVLSGKEDDPFGDVDHQSVVVLPSGEDGTQASIAFAKDLTAWVLSPQVVVLGGNDNSDGHPLSGSGLQVMFQHWLQDQGLTAFKDDSQNTWSLFSKRNGLTLRFSFDDVNNGLGEFSHRLSEEKAIRPNLVDVKITDKCPYQCSYCYQGSTPKGEHAPLSVIYDIVQKLQQEKVFEVAIGGGEPTLHPDFEHIIELFYLANIVPNFTTRNVAFLKNPKNASLLSKVGGVAVSIDTKEDAEKIAKECEKLQTSRVSVQLVVGAQSHEEFKEILDILYKKKISVTLLGFKTTGFGNDFMQQATNKTQIEEAQEHFIEWAQEVHNKVYQGQNYKPKLWLTIDTALAQVCDDQLKEIDKNKTMYHRTEGTTSMYIDAVAQTMSPSSFSEEIYSFDDHWMETYKNFVEAKPKKRIPMRMK